MLRADITGELGQGKSSAAGIMTARGQILSALEERISLGAIRWRANPQPQDEDERSF